MEQYHRDVQGDHAIDVDLTGTTAATASPPTITTTNFATTAPNTETHVTALKGWQHHRIDPVLGFNQAQAEIRMLIARAKDSGEVAEVKSNVQCESKSKVLIAFTTRRQLD